MTRHLIGLNSFNLHDEPKYIEITESQFCYDTIFAIDRSIRNTVAQYPRASWDQIEDGLKKSGFTFPDWPGGSIFWHPRHWDEHLVQSARSFFVTFPDSASPDISAEVFVATSYPGLFAIVPPDILNSNAILLINSQHEIVYPDDQVWENHDRENKISLGPVVVIENQFPTQTEIEQARKDLSESGYEVFRQTFVF